MSDEQNKKATPQDDTKSGNSVSEIANENDSAKVSRRDLLRLGAIGAASAAIGKSLKPSIAEAQINPTAFIKGAASTPANPGAYVWGNGDSLSGGNLGLGDQLPRSSPTQLGSLTTWTAFSTSGTCTAGLKGGELWTWGANPYGELGDSTVVSKSSPIRVGALTTWSAVSAGAIGYVSGYVTYPAGYMAAINTSGQLFTWGNNDKGQLGYSSIVQRSSPVMVGTGTTWSKISCSGGYDSTDTHVMAIRTTGQLWVWGSNNYGQLGRGNLVFQSSPVQVGALTDWSNVYAASISSFAIKTDGTLWSWGANTYGQLGDGTVTPKSSPVKIGALTTWTKLASTGLHTLAVKAGELWAWGNNPNGELGDSTIVNKSSPIRVGALTTWSDVAACTGASFGLKSDGTIWGWGINNPSYTNLGISLGSLTYYSSPVQIGSGTTWTSIVGGQWATGAAGSMTIARRT